MVWALVAALMAGITGHGVPWLAAGAFYCRWLLRHRPPRAARIALALLLCVFALYARHAIDKSHRRAAWVAWLAAAHEAPATVTGRVASFPSPTLGGNRFDIVTELEGVALRLAVKAPVFTLGFGDSVRIRGRLEPDKEGSTYLLGRGVDGRLRPLRDGVEQMRSGAGNPIARHLLWPLHERARRTVAQGVGFRAGLPLALLLGERGFIDRRVAKSFTTLGISHLLALSGMHLGIVAGLVLLGLRLVRSRRRSPLVLVLALYIGIVGPIVSLYRAFVMVCVLVVASAFRRPLRPLAALGDALLIMLLWAPNVFYSVAFQLSFMATFAVLVAVGRLAADPPQGLGRRLWRGAIATVWVGVVAQLVVAPVVLHYFGRVSLVAPFGTLLFFPPVVVLVVATAVSALAAAAHTTLGGVCFDIVYTGTRLFEDALLWCADRAPASLELDVPHAATYYGALLAMWAGRRTWWVVIGGILLLVVSFLM